MAFDANLTLWVTFNAIIILTVALDLGVLSRKPHVVSFKEAAAWSTVWIALSLVFNWFVYFLLGQERALEFLTGYLIEKSLSVDNMFVFVLIFSYFNIPPIWQPRVLKWGIIGALIMRALLILAGAAALEAFHGLIYLFGGILIVTGLRMMTQKEAHVEPEKNLAVRIFRRIMAVSDDLHNEKFIIRSNGVRLATPLLLALIVVETSDLLFAVDSIPAVFAITTDTLIVYTSNIFAILGLRALYFLLSGMLGRFRYLKWGLSMILLFVGGKMLTSDFFSIPITLSLVVVLGILATSLVASALRSRT